MSPTQSSKPNSKQSSPESSISTVRSAAPAHSTYRFVVQAYPRNYRQAYGPELVATANELSPDGWSLRQARSLLVEGLRTRARSAVGKNGNGLWCQGVALGVVLMYLTRSSAQASYLLGVAGDGVSPASNLGFAAQVIFGLAVVAMLTITTRWPTALFATVLTVATFAALGTDPVWRFVVPVIVGQFLLLGILWWLAFQGDGRRALSPAVAVLLFAGSVALNVVLDGPASIVPSMAFFFVLPAGGLLLLTIDPRPLIAGAMVWLNLAAWTVSFTALQSRIAMLQAVLMLAGTGLALAAARYGNRRLARY